MSFDCSIIILSYNTKDITSKCLTKVKEAKDFYETHSKGKIEVFVIDNASTDGSTILISKKFPWVKLIENTTNTGFSKGNNDGLKLAKGKFFLVLNSDAFIKKDTLVNAVSSIQDLNVDLIGCRQTYKDGSFQPSGGYIPSPINAATWMLGLEKFPLLDFIFHPVHPSHQRFFARTRPIGWVMGAFMFMKREVFEKTGGFDENYFMYMEEVEWCKRINDSGFKIWYVPTFSIVHLGRASSNYDSAKPLIQEAKGLLYFTRKHYPRYASFVKLIMRIGFSIRFFLFSLLGNKEKTGAYLTILKEL